MPSPRYSSVMTPERWQQVKDIFESAWGALYQRQGKYVEAELLLFKVAEVHRRGRGEEFAETLAAMTRLATPYQDWGKPEQAAERRAKLDARKAAAAQKQ